VELSLQWSTAQYQMFFEDEKRGRFRLYPKGRRLGATRGGAQAVIVKLLKGEGPILWGDEVHANISRYIEAYFKPILNRLPKDSWKFNGYLNRLQIGPEDQFCDFRSARNPSTWEGFGYRTIYLNEAGIILKNKYLWEHAVSPMLMDFNDSQLVAFGTPKGLHTYYHELYQRALKDTKNYFTRTYSSYDNPWLTQENINELTEDVPEAVKAQEVYGQFISSDTILVKHEYLQTRKPPPLIDLRITMGVDLAITEKETSDYTAVVVLGQDRDGYLYILDVRRARLQFHKVLGFITDIAYKYHVSLTAVETNQYQQAVEQELLRTTQLNIKGVHAESDKITRFLPLAARYERKLVYHSPDLIRDFEKELTAFPQSEHDDMVDALAYSFIALRYLNHQPYTGSQVIY